MTNKIEFKPSNVHQGHYVFINGESADMVVNLFAYNTIDNYKNKIDNKINNSIKTRKTLTRV